MRAMDFVKALGVAIATLVITLAASFPMVAFYAFFIEPGHPQEFYNEAAQWIAPWSSHVLGPLVFFAFNFWLARRSPERHATLFAAATVVFYAVVDLSTLPMMGLPIAAALTATFGLSLCAKAAGAFLGAYLGSQSGAKASRSAS
jgi:hypothetical protein